MIKKVLACSFVSLFLFCGAVSYAMATDAGPAEIEMIDADSKKPKLALFPHKKHQDPEADGGLNIACGECHHGMAEGKQVAYAEGQKMQKCIECHKADTALAGKTKGKLKLDTIKGAGHGNCLACHKEMAKKDAALKEKKIDKCATCHPKKKK